MSIKSLISTVKPVKNDSTGKTKISTKISRVEATVKAVNDIPETGINPDTLLNVSDKIYTEKGGKSNLSEAFFNFSRTIEALSLIGYIAEKDGKIFLASKKVSDKKADIKKV